MLKGKMIMELAVLFAAFFVLGFFSRPNPIQAENLHPVAQAKAVVRAGNARFTILFPEMIRMEWSPNGQFEDRASLAFINRNQLVPEFSVHEKNGWLEIQTEQLFLRYKKNSGSFSERNLQVELTVAGKRVLWKPGMKDKGNLLGTTRTLDTVSGSTPLENGLISRDGWVLVDDSHTPLFTNATPPWVTARPKNGSVDWYFFGYGHNYKKALSDFTKVAGKIPMPPKFAFGIWWSRYWAYTDRELEDLIRQFQNHTLPLDVLVVDMDWHLEGWTGYTWNPVYFPDPKGFARWVHRQGIKLTLNLHPASGVKPHEKAYPQVARAMGIDPKTRQPVLFEPTDPQFMDVYFRYLHHPLERDGVDFWWLDWQQGTKTKIPGLDPLWWLNYLHFTDMARFHPRRRPLIFSRWGGLGNHRYQIGFSGDVRSTWASLDFQPYFTATAANVGYGYWSHDIGGHWGSKLTPELYTRWIQWGAFSPVLRTHVTKDPRYERRIWGYPFNYYTIMRQAFLRRIALLPYIYTESRRTYDTGLAFLHPLYYDFPEREEAYQFKNEYFFGKNLLVAPITAPVDTISGIAVQDVWLPPGNDWYEWDTGRLLKGGQVVSHGFALNQIPVYVKAGAIVPMQSQVPNTGVKPDRLILSVFPGKNGRYRLYEDEGNSQDYQKNVCAWTTFRQKTEGQVQEIWIDPVKGNYPGMPKKRAVEIHLIHTWPPKAVFVNGKPLSPARPEAPTGYWYDGDRVTTIIRLPKFPVAERQEIRVQLTDYGKENVLLQGFRNKLERLKTAKEILKVEWPESLVWAIQTGNRIGLKPETALEELKTFEKNIPGVVNDIIKKNPIDKELRAVLANLFGFYQTVQVVPSSQKTEKLLAKVRVGLTDLDWQELKHMNYFSGELTFRTRGGWKLPGKKSVSIPNLATKPLEFQKTIEDGEKLGEFEVAFETKTSGRVVQFVTTRGGNQAIRHWWVLGPFPNPNPRNLNTPFINEGATQFDLTKPVQTENGQIVKWREVTPETLQTNAFEDFSIKFRQLYPQVQQNVVVYTLTFVVAKENMVALLALGSDDAVAVWVNGKLVHENPVLRAYHKMSDIVPISLKKGKNVILAKITQAGGGWEFGAYLLNLQHKMLEGVEIVRE